MPAHILHLVSIKVNKCESDFYFAKFRVIFVMKLLRYFCPQALAKFVVTLFSVN
jgi:hypothetical protein